MQFTRQVDHFSDCILYDRTPTLPEKTVCRPTGPGTRPQIHRDYFVIGVVGLPAY